MFQEVASLIIARDLRKSFVRKSSWFRRHQASIKVEAVKGLSFDIEQGEFVGFLGPNGAGKSTTIKMLTGILHPTSGDVTVAGLSPQRDRVRLAKQIGVVFGQRTQLWWDLPLIESFRILKSMYKIDTRDYDDRMATFTDLLDITSFQDTPVRQLSLGQRMRGELAGALLHEPQVLFLDEPTIGLDVNAKAAVRGFLRALNEKFRTTVILTTHDMADVEELCDRLIVINEGDKVFDGPVEEMQRHVGIPSALRVTFRQTPRLERFALAGVTTATAEADGAHTVTVQFNRAQTTATDVLDQMKACGDITDFSMEEPRLESIIQKFYGDAKETVYTQLR